MSNEIYDVAIVGSGAAGSMGALRAVLNNLNTVCFMGSPKTKKRSRATWVGKVENMPALFEKGKAIVQSSQEVFKWIKNEERWAEQLNSVNDAVVKIEGEANNFTMKTSKGEDYKAKYIVLCTGLMDIQPEIQGEIKHIFPMANQGHVEYCIRCDGHKSKGKDTVVIGHTESAPWIAALLKERYDNPSMTVLSNGKDFESAKTSGIWDKLKRYNINIETSPIKEVKGDPKSSGLEAFVLEDGKTIEAQMAYVSLGTIVYNELAKDLGCDIDNRGYVSCNDSGESSIPGVFIAGDLRADHKKQIYTAWDMVVDSVDKIDSYIRKAKRELTLIK